MAAASARERAERACAQGPAARTPVKLLGNLREKCPRSVPVRLLLGHALAGSAPARPSAHARPRLCLVRAAGRCSTAQKGSPEPSARWRVHAALAPARGAVPGASGGAAAARPGGWAGGRARRLGQLDCLSQMQ
jgi:hypothetical protein